MNRAALIGIGTAVPEHAISQQAAADLASSFRAQGEQERVIRALYRRSGVQTRGSVLAAQDGAMGFYRADRPIPSTADRMGVYKEHAATLAARACHAALSRAQTKPGRITHLITVSCTGFSAPGVDLDLIDRLGLPATTRRTNIGFMGCHAAINAIAVARAFAGSDPRARIMVCCVELCSLHFDHAADAQAHVANALFADGCAAAVIAPSDADPLGIDHTGSVILPDSAGMMSWDIGDEGFRMRLSPAVPATLARHVPPWLTGWLAEKKIAPAGVGSWAVHPGGPRVLSELARALGLATGAVECSRQVLSDHGNMSSATLLFIIHALIESRQPTPLLAMAFGPGLAGEAVLFSADA